VRKWDVFHGTTEAEMNAQMSDDKVWERQTKSFSDPEARAWARLGIEDPHQVLGENATKNPGKKQGGGRKLPPTERKAVEILEAEDTWSKAEIRKAYKKLIKVLHPDINGGDRSQEEQLQQVVWAWDQIKESRYFK
jgi:DnaJ-domain-containing protein 1